MNRPASARAGRLPQLADSPAFREATLRSEARRAYAVIGVVAMVLFVVLVPDAHVGDVRPGVVLAATAGLGVLLALQAGALLLVGKARARGGSIPEWFTISSVLVESVLPTGIIVSDIAYAGLAPHVALSAPAQLAYGLLTILTTLRLRPMLCMMAGAVGAAGYAGVFAYARIGLGIAVPTTGLPNAAYVNTALLIVISGLAAAWVARELRGHMQAALGEAETRRRMASIERDLSLARSIQQSLLPRTAPQIPGFEVAGWNRPAAETGGDYYDWHALPDGNLIVTLADVSGHGIGPALVTAACRAYVRASSSHSGDLASLTRRINRLLADDLPAGRFVTMVSVLIGPAEAPLALLSAGHGPIVLYVGRSGLVRDIVSHGLPLAIDPDTHFDPAEVIELAPGDVLALVTDGFVEWSRPDGAGGREQFGLARLRESLAQHASRPAAQMIEAITADVVAFAGDAPQEDDLTMVIIRRVGGAACDARA